MPTSSQPSAWKPWLAAILWTLVIATESSDMFSSSHTGRYLYPLLTWLFGPIDPIRYEFWHGLARKAGHVVGYGVLCFLYFRAWRATLRPLAPNKDAKALQRWSLKWATLALIFTALVASMDEWHQSYIPSRTGTWHDVLLDSTAALVALILIRFWVNRRTKSAAIKKEEVFTTN